MNRRMFIQTVPAAALAAQAPVTGVPTRVKARASKEIAASPISIGFETLDRKMFEPERTYPHLAKLGVKWARCQTGWARTESRKGEFDFRWLDEVVDSLLGIGIQPWFNLGYGNTLYTPGAAHESAVGWAPLNNDDAKQAWLRYVDKIGERYASRVKHWEIWNEPNIAGFWQPEKPDPARYVELVRMTAPVLRKRVPGSVLIGGAYAGLTALDYFEGCFESGLANLVDKVSYHPYRGVPEENYENDLRAFRGIINRYKPGMPIWQGENGAPSTNNSTGALRELEWDEARQARWLLRRLMTDLALDVEVSSYFQTVDMVNYVWSSGQSGMTNSKGVLRGREYTPKASYYALQNLCAIVDSDLKRTDLLVRAGGPGIDSIALRTASFVKKGRPVYAWWHPANLQKGFESQKARLTVWSGKAAKLDNAAIVDLLTGDIVPAPKPASASGLTAFDSVPVRDYPLLLTDASLLT
jgi:hypothetical protein